MIEDQSCLELLSEMTEKQTQEGLNPKELLKEKSILFELEIRNTYFAIERKD